MDNIAYWEESEQRKVCANKLSLFQVHLGIPVLVATPGKLFRAALDLFPLLSLETALPALKLTENCYLNMNISFS